MIAGIISIGIVIVFGIALMCAAFLMLRNEMMDSEDDENEKNLLKHYKLTTEELLRISNNYGCPVYVYDSNKIIDQYHKLNDSFGEVRQLKINYAVKALSNLHILKLIRKLGGGLDTVSIEEIKTRFISWF